jgi:hypothetical protein
MEILLIMHVTQGRHYACDMGSTLWMLAYAPHVSHKLKEFI